MSGRVVLHQDAIDDLKVSSEVRDALDSVGGQVASTAAALAPKNTGAGAASIHHEVDDDGTVRVTWDSEHDYMQFQELGTSKMSPNPFLRPALDGSYTP